MKEHESNKESIIMEGRKRWILMHAIGVFGQLAFLLLLFLSSRLFDEYYAESPYNDLRLAFMLYVTVSVFFMFISPFRYAKKMPHALSLLIGGAFVHLAIVFILLILAFTEVRHF